MSNVYVEPEPKGRPEGSAITHYVLEYRTDPASRIITIRRRLKLFLQPRVLDIIPLLPG